MKMFVSQKTRLIPILLSNGTRIHRRARLSKDACPNQTTPGEGLLRSRCHPSTSTNRNTKPASRDILPEALPHLAPFWRLCGLGGKRLPYGKGAAVPGWFLKAFGNGRDWALDWPHSVE